jgi:hypothetical protein
MTPDQLHFEKYLLEQSKKRPKVKLMPPPIEPLDLTISKKHIDYINLLIEARIALMKLP